MPDAYAFEELSPPPPVRHAGPDELGARARAIVEAAEAQAARIEEEARAAGFEQGRAAALEQLRPAAQALAESLRGARTLEAGMADHVEAEACRFALAVAEKVVAAAVEARPERILDVIRAALRATIERERVVIQVNPGALEIVRAALADLQGDLGGLDHVDVQEDRRVAPGGAIVRTAVGEIDARLESKLEQLRATLASELRA